MLESQIVERPVRSPDDSPIFIIGTGRSGTTLLRQVLNAHPRIHITHEAAFFSYARHAPKGSSAEAWLERYFETFSFAWLRLDPREVREALPRPLTMEHVNEVARAVMRGKARQKGKPRYGDKNPLDTHNLSRIFSDFPDPRVIYITRDPRPTVLSFNRMPFGTCSTLLNSWLCRLQFQHVQPFLDRILEIRLEDLVADPRRTLQSVLRFVGEHWDDAVLDHRSRTSTDDVPPLPWFVGATSEGLNQNISSGGWQQRMSPAWIRLVEKLNRASMQRYGYEPAKLEHEPGAFALAAALWNDMPGVVWAAGRLLAFKRILDRHFQGKQRLDPQKGMEENMRLNPLAWQHYPQFQMPQVPPLLSAAQPLKAQSLG